MPKRFSRAPTGAAVASSIAVCAALLLGACTPVTYVEAPPPYPEGPPPAYIPPAPAAPAPAPQANPLDQLMAPIALYPDPLISLILPASAFPTDVSAAGAYLAAGGDAGQVDAQPWDPSVRALAHYPEVVTWMAQNGPWTQTVGAAFVSQPAAVMSAIQRLRELARAAGTLTDSSQQQVIVQGSYVEIEPAQPDVIYVPRYDPAVVFVDQPYYGYRGPFFTYGPAYGAGVWLTYGCNWSGGGVLIVGPGYWHGDGGWWRPQGGPDRGGFNASVTVNVSVRPWGFPANRPRPQAPSGWQGRSQVVHPRLAAGAPAQPPASAFRNIHTRGAAAVTVVARNPAAFTGKPVNRAILSKPAAQPARKAPAPGEPSPERKAPEQPGAPAVRPQAAAPERREVASPAKEPEVAPAARAERPEPQSEHAAPGAKPPAKPKPKPKPAPKDEKPREDKPQQPQ